MQERDIGGGRGEAGAQVIQVGQAGLQVRRSVTPAATSVTSALP